MQIGLILSLILVQITAHSVLDFGVIENDVTWFAENTNARAIEKAFMAAHNKDNGDKTVIVPEGTIISSLPIHINNVTDVEFVIDGKLLVSKNY